MDPLSFITNHPVTIFTIVIVVFLLWQFLSWYSKGGKQRIDAIKKAFGTEKDKILSGESSGTIADYQAKLKDNLYK